MAKKKTQQKVAKHQLHIGETGSAFYEENRTPLSDLPEKSWVKHVYKAIDLFKEGLPREAISEMLINSTGLSEGAVRDTIVSKAALIIGEEYSKKQSDVVGLHLERYNQEIRSLKHKVKVGYKNYKAEIRIKLQIAAYFSIMDLMLAKEKLLGIHSKKFVFKFNQKNTTIVRGKTDKWDLTQLTPDERREFLELVMKSKRTSNEVYGVIINNNVTTTTTEPYEEAEYEEILDGPVNVDKIQQKIPLPEKDETPNLAIIDVRTKLQLALERKAKEEFQRAGSKTVQ